MIVVLDSGVWILAFEFGGIPLLAVNRAFVLDRIAFCDPILTEVTTILVTKVGWSGNDAFTAMRGALNGSYAGAG